jgi:precorrin-2 dehydrogenase / sirohydrochlorin ferrochelatase
MTYYPVFLNLGGRRVVVFGGGIIAERKVDALLACGASVRVIAPDATDRLTTLAGSGTIELWLRAYRPGDCRGAFVVIAATDEPEVQQRTWEEAQSCGILINTVDVPARCNFIFPALVQQGDLTLAISTQGKSPAFAAWLRRVLARWIGPEYRALLEMLERLRPEIRVRVPDFERRKRLYESVLDPIEPERLQEKDVRAVEHRLRQALKEMEQNDSEVGEREISGSEVKHGTSPGHSPEARPAGTDGLG